MAQEIRGDARARGTCACCRVCGLEDTEGHGDERGGSTDHSSHSEHSGEGGHGQDSSHDAHSGGDEHAGHGTDHSGHEEMFRRRFWVSTAMSIPVLLWSGTVQGWFSYEAPSFAGSSLIVPLFATAIFAYGGLPFLTMAGAEVRKRAPAMMTLIALAISVAYGFSMLTLVVDIGDDFFWELATLVDIMLLGHWLEMRSVRQASGALGALAELMPDVAEVENADGEIEQVPTSDLSAGQVFLVRPGASVPADGLVTEGESDFDEALITGESRPVERSAGSPLIAGTINSGSGSVRAKVTGTGEQTTLSGIMRLVAEAERSKSPTQLLADRAAALLFYVAVGAALVTALVWTVIYGGADQRTVARVVTVLVIACPHALGLAIPLVVANTTAIAARNGILIRNREAIDTARDLNVVLFDKTGTLTTGQMGVSGIATVDGVDERTAVGLAAAVEGDSEHPMARAIRQSATTQSVAIPDVTSFEAIKGRGVRATVDGRDVLVGGPRLLESQGLHPNADLEHFSDAAGKRGESVVYLIDGDRPVAAIAISDIVRPESAEALRGLKERDVRVGMITGDSDDVAQSVAEKLGLDIVFSQVLPADKDAHVAQLQRDGDRVGMVGDGVNDAPALVRADIGIAIGSGTDVAVQSADLVLVKSDPRDVLKILRLSAASYRKQLQNVWWGAGYNILMIPLAAGVAVPLGFDMPPAIGAALMSLSTIIVAVNAQLLRNIDLND